MTNTNFRSEKLNTGLSMTASRVRVMKRGFLRVDLVQGGWVDFNLDGTYRTGAYPTQNLLNQLNAE